LRHRAVPLALRRPLYALRSLHGYDCRAVDAECHRHDLRPGGETQWMLHPDAAASGGDGKSAVVPLTADPAPYWGSPLDKADRLKQRRPSSPPAPYQRTSRSPACRCPSWAAPSSRPRQPITILRLTCRRAAGHREDRRPRREGRQLGLVSAGIRPRNQRCRGQRFAPGLRGPPQCGAVISAMWPTIRWAARICMGSANSSTVSRASSCRLGGVLYSRRLRQH